MVAPKRCENKIPDDVRLAVMALLTADTAAAHATSFERMIACGCCQCRIMASVSKITSAAYTAATLACSGRPEHLDDALKAVEGVMAKMIATVPPN